MTSSPWRTDSNLIGRFHPECPDDLQVIVHDGEPRRTGRGPESCWVRVEGVHAAVRFPMLRPDSATSGDGADPAQVDWALRVVYRGALLNQPHQLTGINKNGEVLFLHASGLPHPLHVRAPYLEERAEWAFLPCDRCGADQGLDAPTVMAQTRFPNMPAGATPVMFTAFCLCGGTMVLSRLDAAADAKAKPWWKFW